MNVIALYKLSYNNNGPNVKSMAWDVIQYADSHISNTATETGAVAKHARSLKQIKYAELSVTRLFYPVAIITVGTCDSLGIHLRRCWKMIICGRRQLPGDISLVPTPIYGCTKR